LTTDGLSDQNNSERKRYGTNHLINIFKDIYNKPLEIQKTTIENELGKWMDGVTQRDDITLLAIKI
jgi:serine phosphatase RsbU (regulator of sigma subunit)